MIVLQSTTETQTASIYPRFSDNTPKYVIIRKDGEGIVETLESVSVEEKEYYTDISFSCSIFSDDETYYIEVYSLGALAEFVERVEDDNGTIESIGCAYAEYLKENGLNLWYRDKIYITSQTDYTDKHKLSQLGYKEYSDLDDNTYIV
ncbi:MAG: hypothetical protein HRU18_11090 [Pseudoalteromonas sp.]|uniref:hypothetical protein n=1 Tax=Pseudoalteromonas sp. TaxID=53249 RepID=UPI001D33FB5F|nr:hypothetical protein [Pseudoalteromonas sp.]NRA78744.1 hypothetical protein [Pseudoalteromonas sp.]